jgi:hypothetical protein
MNLTQKENLSRIDLYSRTLFSYIFLKHFVFFFIVAAFKMEGKVQIPNKPAKALRARLAVVKRHLEPLLNRPINDLYTKLSITERCELEVLLAYSLNTLYYSKLYDWTFGNTEILTVQPFFFYN